jgi:hypothetical protein
MQVGMPLQRFYRRLRFGEPIVVVSGLPRSGTSMAMRMLAAGGMRLEMDGVRAADDDNPVGYFEDERVKDLARAPDTAWVQNARGKAIKVVSSLLEHLPQTNNYLVLFMLRNLHEVLASQAKMLARRGETSDTDDVRLLELFQQHLLRVRVMLRMRPCFQVQELDYKGVLEDPRRHAERIRTFLQRPLDVDAMVRAVEPSLYRNRSEEPSG